MGNLSDKEKRHLEKKAAAASNSPRRRTAAGVVREVTRDEADFLSKMKEKYVKAGGNIKNIDLTEDEAALLRSLIFVEDDSKLEEIKRNNDVRDTKPEIATDSIPLDLSEEDIKIGEYLGEGVYSEVYKGYVYGTQCAVKKFKNQGMEKNVLDQVRKEVRIMKSIRHPNLLLFLGACIKPGQLMIVMELMNASFHDLGNNPKFDVFAKLNMAKKAATGIYWLHSLQPVIIHRDLKPENILIDATGQTVKVADFGLSLVKDHSKQEMEEMKKIRGSPAFMSPEALLGEVLTPATDVYSFAMILWELYTQLSPYEDLEVESFEELIVEICDKGTRESLPSDCPPSLSKLITACWVKNPAKRPDMQQLLSALDECLLEVAIPDPEGRTFWKKAFSDTNSIKQDVAWPIFLRQIAHYMHQKEDAKIFACMKQMLIREGSTPKVRIQAWGNLLKWFGPLDKNGKETFLTRMSNIMGCRWFHGDISMEQAHNFLADTPNGTYLIRFSSVPGGYALSKITENSKGKKVLHIRISHQSQPRKYSFQLDGKTFEFGSLSDLIGAPVLGLKQSCPGSKYYATLRVNTANQGYATAGHRT